MIGSTEVIVTIDKNVPRGSIDALNKYSVDLVRTPVSQYNLREFEDIHSRLKDVFHGGFQVDLHGTEKGRILESSNMIDSGTSYGKYVPLAKGDKIHFKESENDITSAYDVYGTVFPRHLKVGEFLFVSDDELILRLIAKADTQLTFEVESIRNINGIYPSLGYTSPGIGLAEGSRKFLSEKDLDVLRFVKKHGFNAVSQIAFSFVDKPGDIDIVENILEDFDVPYEVEIVLKLESLRAVESIEYIAQRITKVSRYNLIAEIARGDLGVAAASVGKNFSSLQKEMVTSLKKYNIPFVVATHVFDSALAFMKKGEPGSKIVMTKSEMNQLEIDIQSGAKGIMLAAEGRMASLEPEYLERMLTELETNLIEQTNV